MFNFLKKKETVEKTGPAALYAPITGKMIPLENVQDEVFASKMMGEGVAFELSEDTIYAPIDGEITMFPDSLHAFGMKTADGAEVLIHVGLDTVNLGGEGFTKLADQGDTVTKGTPILQVAREELLEKNIILTTPMIVTNSSEFDVTVLAAEEVTAGETKVLEFVKK